MCDIKPSDKQTALQQKSLRFSDFQLALSFADLDVKHAENNQRQGRDSQESEHSITEKLIVKHLGNLHTIIVDRLGSDSVF